MAELLAWGIFSGDSLIVSPVTPPPALHGSHREASMHFLRNALNFLVPLFVGFFFFESTSCPLLKCHPCLVTSYTHSSGPRPYIAAEWMNRM